MDNLPAEILLQIFENLPYTDLKVRVPLSCKSFQSLLSRTSPTSASAIDRILFRDAPASTTTASALHLHPVFKSLTYYYTPSISDVLLNDVPLSSTPLGNENAVSPSVKEAVYHSPWKGVEPFVRITGTGIEGSVTVMDVMKAAVEVARRCKELKVLGWNYEITGFGWDGLSGVEVDEDVDHGAVRLMDSGGYSITYEKLGRSRG